MKFAKEIKIIQELMSCIGPLSRTKIIKLLFLFDVESVKKLNIQSTNFKYVKYFYGPYDEKIVQILEKTGFFTPQLGFTSSGNIFHLYGTGSEVSEYQLKTETKDLLQKHINKYKDKTLDEIINKAYLTEQFSKTAFGKVILLG